jgi:hypothetical protein
MATMIPTAPSTLPALLFVDEGTHAHIVVNEGTTDLVLVAFQILPRGAPRRIDEPAPTPGVGDDDDDDDDDIGDDD